MSYADPQASALRIESLQRLVTDNAALLAENQRLREDKAWALQLLSVLLNDFEWLLEQHPEHDGKYALDRIEQAREALAGDAE